MTGKVVRFDHVRGYGFIAPDNGDEDVFLHANDLLDEKYLIKPGVIVEFEAEEGGRGLKASSVRIVNHGPATQAPSGESRALPDMDDDGEPYDGLCDVLTKEKYLQEVTEILLRADSSLTGSQILQVRREIVASGQRHGWVEN